MRRFFQSNITFVFVTVLFVMISAFCISQTVSGKEDGEAKEQEAFYREQENKLLADTRAFLNQEGYYNSGVTLTRVVDSDGSREYTITIHHSRIDRMDDFEKQELKNALEELVFVSKGCSFCHTFLAYN